MGRSTRIVDVVCAENDRYRANRLLTSSRITEHARQARVLLGGLTERACAAGLLVFDHPLPCKFKSNARFAPRANNPQAFPVAILKSRKQRQTKSCGDRNSGIPGPKHFYPKHAEREGANYDVRL
jgi:hypothetical protein